MPYNKTTWANAPSTSTPISAANLQKIEDGIAEYDGGIKRLADGLLNSALPNSYAAQTVSIARVLASDGWPSNGLLFSLNQPSANEPQYIWQILFPLDTGADARMRTRWANSSTTWSSWYYVHNQSDDINIVASKQITFADSLTEKIRLYTGYTITMASGEVNHSVASGGKFIIHRDGGADIMLVDYANGNLELQLGKLFVNRALGLTTGTPVPGIHVNNTTNSANAVAAALFQTPVWGGAFGSIQNVHYHAFMDANLQPLWGYDGSRLKIGNTLVSMIEEGSYSGNGTVNRIISTSRAPRLVIVSANSAEFQVFIVGQSFPTNVRAFLQYETSTVADVHAYKGDKVFATAGGFSVGGTSGSDHTDIFNLNASGVTYHWVAIE